METFKNKSVSEIITWIFLAVVFLAPFAYAFLVCADSVFWANTFGNLLTTSLALIAGIPIGLTVDRRNKRTEEQRQLVVDRLREIQILNLLKAELSFSLKSIFLVSRKGNLTSVQIQPYQTDLWDSLSASEQIKYIDSPDLINRIASAYYVIKSARYIETEAYLALRTSAITFTNADGGIENAAQRLIKDARSFDVLFEESLVKALDETEKRIIEISKKVS